MDRYSVIHTKLQREFVLLQGTGCRWKRCVFCDYHNDVSMQPYEINRQILDRVTGIYGVLDVINSGSAMELDIQTVEHIKCIVKEKNIHTIWFEAHYMYRYHLQTFADQFAPAKVKFRCGIESFAPEQRSRWNKGIPFDVTVDDVARYYDGVCLLCCTDDDSKERIIADIASAKRHFEYFSVNLFCNNATPVKRNEKLAEWFKTEIYPQLLNDPAVEVLIDNTDLGVG